MKILVTGAAGFIGSKLCEKLIELQHEVLGMDCMDNLYNNKAKYENIEELRNNGRFKFYRSNINGKKDLDTVKNIDVVIHLAAKPGVRWSYANVSEAVYWNTYATAEFIDYCNRRGFKNIIFISSSTVYGRKNKPFVETDPMNPTSPYGLTKMHCEEYLDMFCKQFGMKAISLRLFSVYGPRQRPDLIGFKLINSILHRKEVEIFGDGNQERDFTYVDDIVDGIIRSMNSLPTQADNSHEVYNLGRGERVALNRVIDLIESEFKANCNKVYVPRNEIDLDMTWADNTKAHTVLGWEPKVKIEDGIKEMVEWFRFNREWVKKAVSIS